MRTGDKEHLEWPKQHHFKRSLHAPQRREWLQSLAWNLGILTANAALLWFLWSMFNIAMTR